MAEAVLCIVGMAGMAGTGTAQQVADRLGVEGTPSAAEEPFTGTLVNIRQELALQEKIRHGG
jgi:hypothetical protein